jgi:hypothetical protein
MASRMGELRYAGTAVAPCDAPQTLWRLSAISSSAASARRPCAPRPPPSRLLLTALASFVPVLALWYPFVAAGLLAARRAIIEFSMIRRLFSWPMRAASGTGDVAGASCSTGQRLRRRRAALHGCGMGSPGCQPVSLPSGCARRVSPTSCCMRADRSVLANVRVCHGREILVSRCERIM